MAGSFSNIYIYLSLHNSILMRFVISFQRHSMHDLLIIDHTSLAPAEAEEVRGTNQIKKRRVAKHAIFAAY